MAGTSVYIEGELLQALELRKKKTGASLGSMARIAISEWLSKQKEASA